MISVNLPASCGATRCHITWSRKIRAAAIAGSVTADTSKDAPGFGVDPFGSIAGNRSARSGMVRTHVIIRERG